MRKMVLRRKDYIVAAWLCALVSSPCPSFAQIGNDGPQPHSRTVHVTTRAPEPDKWDSVSAPNGSQRVFKCKRLACSDPAVVSFVFQKGSFTPPNPETLEKFATIDLPKSIRAVAAARAVMTGITERIEPMASMTTTMKNFPSVLNETKFTRGGVSSIFVETGVIFAGPVIIRIESKSPNRDLAQKSLSQFVEAMQIVEGPSLPMPPATRPPKTQSL